MDRFDQLVFTSRVASCVLGNPATRDFILVSLDAPPMDDALRADAAQRGLYFCGVMGIIDGVSRTELAEALSSEAIAILSNEFVGQVVLTIAARLASLRAVPPTPTDDFVAFMDALIALPDNRD
jgi:hypothetical protein